MHAYVTDLYNRIAYSDILLCAAGAGPVETRTGELVIQEDTIFISGMSTRTTEDDIKDHFGAIGVIKVPPHLCIEIVLSWEVAPRIFDFVINFDFRYLQNDRKTGKPKIWIYMDKQSGRSKGEATVTFEDAHTAAAAIEWFDGKLLQF